MFQAPNLTGYFHIHWLSHYQFFYFQKRGMWLRGIIQ